MVSPAHKPTPSPLPGGEPATCASNEAPLLGGAGGGFMGAMRDNSSGKSLLSSSPLVPGKERKQRLAQPWKGAVKKIAGASRTVETEAFRVSATLERP